MPAEGHLGMHSPSAIGAASTGMNCLDHGQQLTIRDVTP
jgi:hypothetical protein